MLIELNPVVSHKKDYDLRIECFKGDTKRGGGSQRGEREIAGAADTVTQSESESEKETPTSPEKRRQIVGPF